MNKLLSGFVAVIFASQAWAGGLSGSAGGLSGGVATGITAGTTTTTCSALQLFYNDASGKFNCMAGTSWDDTNQRLGLGTVPSAALHLGSNAGTAASGIQFGSDTNLYRSGANTLKTDDALIVTNSIYLPNNTGLVNSSTSNNAYLRMNTAGAILTRDVADANPSFIVQQVNVGSTGDILQLKNNATTLFTVGQNGSVNSVASYFGMTEMTAPAAPAANGARLYCDDNGAGKTRCSIIFATGAAQQIAIEP